jgi:hypothetical protein
MEKGRLAMTLDPNTEEGRKALKENFDAMVDKIRETSSCPEEFSDMVDQILGDHKHSMAMEREAFQRLEMEEQYQKDVDEDVLSFCEERIRKDRENDER